MYLEISLRGNFKIARAHRANTLCVLARALRVPLEIVGVIRVASVRASARPSARLSAAELKPYGK